MMGMSYGLRASTKNVAAGCPEKVLLSFLIFGSKHTAIIKIATKIKIKVLAR